MGAARSAGRDEWEAPEVREAGEERDVRGGAGERDFGLRRVLGGMETMGEHGWGFKGGGRYSSMGNVTRTSSYAEMSNSLERMKAWVAGLMPCWWCLGEREAKLFVQIDGEKIPICRECKEKKRKGNRVMLSGKETATNG